jgi:HK97 family phage portal protein
MKLKETAIKLLASASLKEFIVNLLPGQRNDGLTAMSRAGVSINERNALTTVTVYACVRILSETMASLPLMLYRRLGRGKGRASDHEIYRILHDQPNPEMTSFIFRETLMGHLATWGNAYAQIEWEDRTRIKALWPLYPDRMQVVRDLETKQIVYKYYPSSAERAGSSGMVTLPAYRILHIPGLGFDGMVGYSPISLAREAIGLAKATEEFGSTFFKNGAHASGVLEHPSKLGDVAFQNLKKSFTEQSTGLGNAHKPLILEEGMKWHELSIPPEDAQFLATREFQRDEIASFFHIPPHMIGDLSHATFSNIEEQALEFVVYTMRPWLVRWEQTMNMKLLTPEEQQTYFTEFLVDGLLRGNIAARYNAYATGRQWGWLSANDIRELENMNPLPGEQGDTYLTPLNMSPADQLLSALNKPKA